jgi:hypothetical protein
MKKVTAITTQSSTQLTIPFIMDALEQHGYSETINMTYVEVENGTHDTFTWERLCRNF